MPSANDTTCSLVLHMKEFGGGGGGGMDAKLSGKLVVVNNNDRTTM